MVRMLAGTKYNHILEAVILNNEVSSNPLLRFCPTKDCDNIVRRDTVYEN